MNIIKMNMLSIFFLIFVIIVENRLASAKNKHGDRNKWIPELQGPPHDQTRPPLDVQVCIVNNMLTNLTIFKKTPKNCQTLKSNRGVLHIDVSNITAVAEGWSSLTNRDVKLANISAISFDGVQNEIVLFGIAYEYPWYIEKFVMRSRMGHVNSLATLYSGMKSLDLDSNDLTEIPTEILKNHDYSLHSLSLGKNRIGGVDVGAFDGLRSLRYIDLRLNDIRYLQAGAFKGPQALETVILDDNPITTIARGTFDLPDLKLLSLKGCREKILRKGVVEFKCNDLCDIYIGEHEFCSLGESWRCNPIDCLDYTTGKYPLDDPEVMGGSPRCVRNRSFDV